ncbi:pre translocase subunit [Chlorella sorokiniana]|uniref:chloroplast protein-transporting ATPase n=1 Tax=Chlorella sorokiniana TaxID=3076 RepID=A0A2P6TYW6_CHLSO|nr:pre translocase subunit [Chlorella sorokiniana]|eukprot:PRW59265.1 pre translocase subunit [Chlorella sorokiniana]
MRPWAACSAAAARRPAAQQPQLRQSRLLQRQQRRPGRLSTSVQSPGAPPAPLAPEDDGQDSELELSVRPVQGQEQPAALPAGRAVEGLLPHHWEEHLQTLHVAERRDLGRYIAIVRRINALRGAMAALSDDELAAKTGELRYRIEAAGLGGPDPGSSPADILSGSADGSYASPGGSSRERRRAQAADWRRRGLLGGLPEDVVIEGFAVVREAAHRVLGMRHYDVQLLGGLVLHEGQIAEMRTGEGKTLVATLPAYVNALTGRGVHIITVNGYLARRDAEWIGKVFKFLGLSVGVLASETPTLAQRIAALACDVTYTTAYDLAFTYLQDNISVTPRDVVIRRPLHFALVDEADSLLIDEAINPFILTGPLLDARSQGARWAEAVAVARKLSCHAVEQLGISEKDWQELERQYDCIVRTRYMSADLSNRGMVAAVRTLVERGTVRLCTDADGRLAVAMLNPTGAEPGSTAGGSTTGSSPLLGSAGQSQSSSSEGSSGLNPDPAGAAPAAAGANGAGPAGAAPAAAAARQPIRLVLAYATLPDGSAGSRGGKAIAEVPLDSSDLVDRELEKRGLQPLPTEELAQHHFEAAMPAVMWGGSQAWGMAVTTALRALHCYIRDMHYIVNQAARRVVLIDQGTGRERLKSMWQAGVHQAVEAKEGLPVSAENYTTASVSYQSLFGYYRRLAGMTGTGFTELQELDETYGLAVVRVPPHRPSVRVDSPMRLFMFEEGRDKALLKLLLEAQQRQQPVLIGTGTVEESAQLHKLISHKLKVWHERKQYGLQGQPQVELLNARPETVRREATIIAQAGLPGSVTIATALAGRGTDILLGGNPKGLTQMLLENRLLERLAGTDAGDLGDYDLRRPLTNLTHTLLDLDECDLLPLDWLGSAAADPASVLGKLAMDLPVEVCGAYCELRAALAALLPEASAAAEQPPLLTLPPLVPVNGAAAHNGAAQPTTQLQHSAGTASAAAAPAAATPPPPPAGLPWRRYGVGYNKRAAQFAADWLSQQLEAAEMQRAHLRLAECLQLPGPAAFQEAARRIRAAEQQQREEGASGADARVVAVQAALQRFILLQWLWFERMCGMYARKVRAAGGLCVIVASLPDNKRSELQLRGRAGRQGDPGESHLVLSLDDPVLAIRSPGLRALTLAAFEASVWNGAYTVKSYREHLKWEEKAIVEAMKQNARLALYSSHDAEEDPVYRYEKDQLCQQMAGYINSINIAISGFEAHMRSARSSVREYDQVLDRYRRHIYTLRRVLVQGGAAGRQSLLHSAFEDAARVIVSRMIDADQPLQIWPLLELVQQLEAVVNSCPPGKSGPFNGTSWLAQVSLQQVVVQVNMRPAETAQELAAALRGGGALPEPPVLDPTPLEHEPVEEGKWQGRPISTEELLSRLDEMAAQRRQELEAAEEAAARAAAGRPRLRERQALAAQRARSEAAAGGAPAESGSAAVLGLYGLAPPPRGRHAEAARQLAAWVAEQLVMQHRNKRAILKQWYRTRAAASGQGGVADATAEGVLLVRERALLVTRLDALWAGFLEACQRKQREVSMRSFASYNPLEEYQVETSHLFAQLLLDFKQQAAADAFKDVDLLSLESAAWAGRSGAAAAEEEEEEEEDSGSGDSGSGARGTSRAPGSLGSIDTQAAGAAVDLGELIDRLGLGAQVAAEAERLVAAAEAQRQAAANAQRQAAAEAAAAAAEADAEVAEKAVRALEATASATEQLLALVIGTVRQRNEVLRQLPLHPDPAALPLLQQADERLQDAVRCAEMCLGGPALQSEQRLLDVWAAMTAWEKAADAGDSAGMAVQSQRLRQLLQEAEEDSRRADGQAVRATLLVDEADTLLRQALALPPRSDGSSSDGSSSGGDSSGGSSSSSSSVLRAQDSPAVLAMLAEGEEMAEQMGAALTALKRTSRPAQQQQQPAAMPDPTAVVLGAAVGALAATRLGQPLGQPGQQQQAGRQPGSQQRQLPGTTDLPSAVLVAQASPQQASSAAIDAALAQAASPASGDTTASSSDDEQAVAAAELKSQLDELTPQELSGIASLVLERVAQKITSSATTAEALAMFQLQGTGPQQAGQLPPTFGATPPQAQQPQAEQAQQAQQAQQQAKQQEEQQPPQQ